MKTDSRTLRGAALLAGAIVLAAAGVASAQKSSLQDIAKVVEQLPQIVIYTAKEIVTLNPANPSAQAVAVVGDRILAVGPLTP